MTTKSAFTASAAMFLCTITGFPAHAGEVASNAGKCLIAGWENPASVCLAHTKSIAATCFICHGPNGKSNAAIPGLAGQDKAYLLEAMRDFKSGKRESTVMQKYMLGYSDTEYADLAAYFSAIK